MTLSLFEGREPDSSGLGSILMTCFYGHHNYQDRQCMYNVTLRRVRVTVVVETQ